MKQDSSETVSRFNSVIRYKMILGFVLCGIYALFYAGFVAISVVNINWMDLRMPFGLNLGVFYGIGLILLAFVLGLAYNFACTRREQAPVSTLGASDEGKGQQ
jgi:uncharacterized membrane protein (DUF485 family)